jgi:hypothetical protein
MIASRRNGQVQDLNLQESFSSLFLLKNLVFAPLALYVHQLSLGSSQLVLASELFC